MMLDKITYLVRDYDQAIDWFSRCLGFKLLEDSDLGGGKRWVVMQPSGGGVKLLLAKATTGLQLQSVGSHVGDRVGFFLHVNNFDNVYNQLRNHDVRFLEDPRTEPYGRVVVFFDLYGNKWDLIEPKY